MSNDEKNMKIAKRKSTMFDIYENVFENMERHFMEFFQRPFAFPSWDSDLCCLQPLIEYKITKDEVLISADLPNVGKDNIEVNATENSIEIIAEMKSEISFDKWGTKSFQKKFRHFHKSITLPLKINVKEVKATFKQGILQIKAPIKREKTKIKIE
ncbi:MAG: Hsp20/alpha crystallin family protein [Candidatus Helarchaeota archaeon]